MPTKYRGIIINLLDTVIHRLNNCGLSIRLSYGNGQIEGKEKKLTSVGIESTTLALDRHCSLRALGGRMARNSALASDSQNSNTLQSKLEIHFKMQNTAERWKLFSF